MYSNNKRLAKRIDEESSAAKARENAVRRSPGRSVPMGRINPVAIGLIPPAPAT
jgi:hypothetical protein